MVPECDLKRNNQSHQFRDKYMCNIYSTWLDKMVEEGSGVGYLETELLPWTHEESLCLEPYRPLSGPAVPPGAPQGAADWEWSLYMVPGMVSVSLGELNWRSQTAKGKPRWE